MSKQSQQDKHETVLLHEAVDALLSDLNGIYVDATFGRGGHSKLILERLNQGCLVGSDRDPEALAAAELLAQEYDNFLAVKSRISKIADLPAVLPEPFFKQATAGFDGILMDLGVSSPQIDDSQRGFSFSADGPLDMRMDNTTGVSAAEVVNQMDETELANVIYRYGDEKKSRRIARSIVSAREVQPFATTKQLADLIAKQIGWRERAQHPATRTFQALRIHVNQELQEIEQGLVGAVKALKSGGVLVVISFHSLEDRILKQYFNPPKTQMIPGIPMELPEHTGPIKQLGKAIKPSEAEIKRNPRSRSAIMRIGVKQ